MCNRKNTWHGTNQDPNILNLFSVQFYIIMIIFELNENLIKNYLSNIQQCMFIKALFQGNSIWDDYMYYMYLYGL